MWMGADEIRENFLKFFENKNHKILPSASLIPKDPQLLFTIAGMVPFKPIFWGKVEPTYTRVVTCQKCLRTNDIENVGRTPRHHTFFEMLGNFSFGDYFKEEAIIWAWEFLTEVLKIPEERLWVSVYKDDDEAYKIWADKVGVPERKIIRFGKEENWWGPAGPTGPCGPDSEIYFDTQNGENCSIEDENCNRYIEIWNLVFTEYYQDEKGQLHPLPRKNIDTGAGLERLAVAMQGVFDNFDTDLFKPIINRVEEIFEIKYGENAKKDISIRVIADHARAITFVISEGVFPSNEKRGYVLRRIIRRASRHGALLGKNEPFLSYIVEAVVKRMGDVYPEIKEKEDFVKKIVKNEEERFLKTLEKGMKRLKEIIENLEGNVIPGEKAFELYDTYGFPIDITKEIALDYGFKIDEKGFEESMKKQQKRAREKVGERKFVEENEAYKFVGEELKTTDFVGYEKFESKARVIYLIKGQELVDKVHEGEEVVVVVDKTPFYAEKGGQVADTGYIENENFKGHVFDVQILHNDVIGHFVRIEKGVLKKGERVNLKIDEDRRKAIMKNHTATHLLHAALRKVLGTHVKQAGSLVAPDRLRFDFTHYEKLSDEQIVKIEDIVNEKIQENLPVIIEKRKLKEINFDDVIALFEEKYGDEVRVVKIKDFSAELCGGTHVKNTGEIGIFKIISENSISAGIRRIEAITGFEAINMFRHYENNLKEISKVLEVPLDKVYSKVQSMILEMKKLEKENHHLEEKINLIKLQNYIDNAIEMDGIKVVCGKFEDVDSNLLRNLGDIAVNKIKKGIVVLFNVSDKKLNFIVKISKNLEDFHAGEIARRIAKELGGGGGGRKDFAQAGGKSKEKLEEVIRDIKKYLKVGD